MALEMDPGVESNPGPGLVDTITTEEKTAFNKVQRLNHRIASAASHRYFLSVCINRNLLPKGYKPKTPIVTSSPNQSLADHKCDLTKENIIKLMKADVNHYDKILPSLVIERDLAYSDLKEVCTTIRFQSLENYLRKHSYRTTER